MGGARLLNLLHEFQPELPWQVATVVVSFAMFEVKRCEFGGGFRKNPLNAMPTVGAGFKRRRSYVFGAVRSSGFNDSFDFGVV